MTQDSGADGGTFAVQVACTDTADALYADPGALPSDKGAIIRCHQDADISKADLQATASAMSATGDVGYTGKPFTSGAHVYRILYRTERGNSANTPGYSTALVYVPDTPRTPAGSPKVPVVLAAHGSRGQAAKCAPSKNDPAGQYVEGDFVHQVYPLVGAGYLVVAPDWAGYANYGAPNNPPSGYGVAADVGKSMLDAARAAQKMFAGSVTNDVVVVGHSQGGHTALSTLGYWQQYAPELNLDAVVVYAPLWLPARSYAALFLAPNSYPIKTAVPPKVSFWYHYTKAALEDGIDHAGDIFTPTARPVIKSFVDNDCWSNDYPELDSAFGSANDAFDPAFVNDIKTVAGPMESQCSTDACTKWMARYNTERPHATGKAAQVPILFEWGDLDQTLTPDLAACAHDRLVADNTKLTVCVDPAQGHSSIVATKADYANDWIATQLALPGTTPVAPCDHDWSAAKDDAGTAYVCNTLIVNNED